MADREKVIEGLCDVIGIIHGYIPKRYWGYGEQACRDAIALLKEPEIVRCKNCRSNHQCAIQFKFADADDEENWFCADGKRR